MSEKQRRVPAAALAGGLIVLAALGCGGKQGLANRSTPAVEAAPAAAPSGQPAKTLSPDALDAPAETSVLDARRSEEMAEGMAGGGHAGHGEGTYRQVDAGRGPEAARKPHDHGEHRHGDEAAVYVCPMHPEVTSTTPGTCPICGMALVERRKE